MMLYSVVVSLHLISMISGAPTRDGSAKLSDDALEERLQELTNDFISMISGVPTKCELWKGRDCEWEKQMEEWRNTMDPEVKIRVRKLVEVRDAGNFFSRWNCEWVEYLETCDYEEDCSGFIKSQKTNWSLEWTSCNDTIVDHIMEIFPDVVLKFDQKHRKPGIYTSTKKSSGRRCIPFLWDGPEFCGPIEEEHVRAVYIGY